MPDTTLILNGFNFLTDVSLSPVPNGGYLGEGQVTITDGYMPFEADDIIVIHVINTNSDLEVTGESRIIGITVYDNATDYFNNVVLYDYTANPPGINISDDSNSLGDTYMQFNANTLNSTDPKAPDLSQVFLAAGVDLSGIESGDTVTIDTFSDIDFNQDNTIGAGTVEEGNGAFTTENNIFAVICFAHGTLIDAPGGPRYVDSLKPGDLVNTLDHGAQPIRWIGARKISGLGKHAPIKIKAGVLGNVRDLYVSPNHRMLVRGPIAELHFGHHEVLVAAKHLVDGHSISVQPKAQVEYFHFLLDQHEIVFAEACPSESLHLGKEAICSVTDESRAEIAELFPECKEIEHEGQLARYALDRHESDVWKICA